MHVRNSERERSRPRGIAGVLLTGLLMGAGVGPAAASSSTPRPDLVARCLWAERGWQQALAALDAEGSAEAHAELLGELEEHARLHGWIGAVGDGLSWMIELPASCPPAALFDLSQRSDAISTGDATVANGLARVFAENGHPEHATELVTEPATRARLFAAAGRWNEVLALLEPLDAPMLLGLRLRALLEVGRTAELETRVIEALAARYVRGEHVPGADCHAVELLLEAWDREGRGGRASELVQRVELQAGSPVEGADRRALGALRDTAHRHRYVLELPRGAARRQLTTLLTAGDHRRDVLERIENRGTDEIDALVEQLVLLVGQSDVDSAHTLWALVQVLAETGDPRVLPALEALESTGELEPLARWEAAHRLREDLSPSAR